MLACMVGFLTVAGGEPRGEALDGEVEHRGIGVVELIPTHHQHADAPQHTDYRRRRRLNDFTRRLRSRDEGE